MSEEKPKISADEVEKFLTSPVYGAIMHLIGSRMLGFLNDLKDIRLQDSDGNPITTDLKFYKNTVTSGRLAELNYLSQLPAILKSLADKSTKETK